MTAKQKAVPPVEVNGRIFEIESAMAIELRRIMIRLGRLLDFGGKVALMVTSSECGEGKSLFSLHFALVLAHHLQKRILLFDGDVRRPVQHGVFGHLVAPGFGDLLAGTTTIAQAVRTTPIDNLDLLPAGSGGKHPSRLFSGHKMSALVAELQKDYDIILIDSPPVVPVSDPLLYVEAVDGVLYLVMAGHTDREVSKRGVEILKGAGANILGVVANNLAEVLPYYYDHKYYGYETGPGK